MKFLTQECPKCGANLEIEDGLLTFYCKYCGQKVILEGQGKNVLKSKVRMKEIESRERLKESEFAHRERMKNIELSQERYSIEAKHRERKQSFRTGIIKAVGAVGLFCLALAICFYPFHRQQLEHRNKIEKLEQIEQEIISDIESDNLGDAYVKTNQLYLDDSWSSNETSAWDEKRFYYQQLIEEIKREEDIKNPTTIFAPQDSKSLKKFTKDEALALFQDSGFLNIECVEVNGSAGFLKKKNLIEHINIEGVTEFTTEDYFSNDSKVVIYYYAK